MHLDSHHTPAQHNQTPPPHHRAGWGGADSAGLGGGVIEQAAFRRAIAVLDLVVHHPELVRNAVVHEVAMAGAAALLADLATLDNAAVVESCKFAFGHVMNDDLAAWEALGDEYHARLANNYVTWVRRYVAPEPPPPHSTEDLAGKPITWTIGGLNPAGMFFDNVVLAVKSGCPISLLNCKHFPQVSAAGMLAEHIRASTLAH
jgi:hypothetical protein